MMQSGCIHIDDLRLRRVVNTENTVARGLGTLRGDADLLSDESIEQGGFPGIRPADNDNKSAMETVVITDVALVIGFAIQKFASTRGSCLFGMTAAAAFALHDISQA